MRQRNSIGLIAIAAIILILPVTAFIPSANSSDLNLPQTGQSTVSMAGDDGDLQAGVYWPNTGNMGSGRFNDNGDGTVTDLLTGLMWTKDALQDGVKTFYGARDAAAVLTTGTYTDWRVPNNLEMESLTNAGEADTAAWLNAEGFTNVQSSSYWSSTQYISLGNGGWTTNLGTDETNYWLVWDTDTKYYWPVRAGANGVPDATYPANIRKTGRTTSVTAGDDGDLEWGVDWELTTRYTDNADGTISDGLTGLMWKNSDQELPIGADGIVKRFQDVIQYVDDMNTQANGRCIKPAVSQDCSNRPTFVAPTEPCTDTLLPNCVYGDGFEQCRSTGDTSCTMDTDCDTGNGETCVYIPNEGYTDWRLPNKKEMLSLIDWEDEYSSDELASAGFSLLPTYGWCAHWTSTTDPANTNNILTVPIFYTGGQVTSLPMDGSYLTRCRGESYDPYYFFAVRAGAIGDDRDGDGYTIAQNDCDDSNPAINPGAVEVCNGIDDDCDETVDDGLSTTAYYEDADSDGYGNPNNSIQSCDVPPIESGYIADNTDCDDTNGAVNPGAAEVCNNGIDDNCNGVIDEAVANDGDCDGYAPPEDCDDTNPDIHPGATELCNSIDDDCDGTVDGGSDLDVDGVGSVCDNCPGDYNPDQAESDGSVPGMRAYWKLEEGVGFVAYDTARDNNGTVFNATWSTGQVGNALIFKGVHRSDVSIIDDSSDMIIVAPSIDEGISIEVWVYADDGVDHYAPEWATLGVKSSYGCKRVNGVCVEWHWYDDGYGLFYQPADNPAVDEGHMAFFINHYDNNKAYSGDFTKDAWHHVVGTYDGANIRVYVDGVEGTPYGYTADIVDATVNGRFMISGT